MSLNLGVMYAAVTLYNKDYIKKLKELENNSDDTFRKIAQMAAGYLSLRAITSFAQKSIQTFSDLEEETNKFNVVFQNMGKETQRVLAELQKDFGLSELSAKKMLAGTGDMLTGFGFDRKTALDLSEAAAKLGSDLASFSNFAGGASGATNALTKAMLGETEGAKMLGIVIKQDSEEYKKYMKQAMTTGLYIEALGKTFHASGEQQAKAIAAMNIAYEQSPNAIGDFVRSQSSLANQTRILQNRLESLYTTIGKDMQGSFAGGLSISNKLLDKYLELSPATRSLTNNTLALSAAMLMLGKSGLLVKGNLAIVQILRNSAAMYLRMSRAATIGGKANVFFGGTLRAVKAAATGLYAALGPLGIAMMSLSAGYLAYSYIMKQYTSELEGAVNLADKQVEAAESASIAHQEQAQKAQDAMSRLEELSKYERLSNIEQEEASRLIKDLTAIYPNLEVSIDKATGKVKIAAAAWKELNEAQRKQAFNDVGSELQANVAQTTALQNSLSSKLGSFWKETAVNQAINTLSSKIALFFGADPAKVEKVSAETSFTALQNELNAITKLKTAEEQVAAFKQLQNKLLEANKTEEADIAEKIIKNLEAQIAKQKKMNELRKAGARAVKPKGKTALEQAELSKEQRRAMTSAQDTAFDIELSRADASKQVEMLQKRINDTFKGVSGRFSTVDAFVNSDFGKLSEKELKDVKTILDLQKRIADIKKESGQNFKSEQENHAKFLAQRANAEQRRQVESQLTKLTNRGDITGARAIAQAQLDKAKKDAEEAKRNFETALREAEKDQILTEAERKNLQKLKDQMQANLADQDHWQSRIDSGVLSGKADARNAKSVASWSLSGLAAQLGKSNTPAQETANNTKKSYAVLQEINRNLKNQSYGIVYE